MDSVNFINLEYVFLRIFEFFQNFDIIVILNYIIHFIEAIRPFAIIFTLFLAYVIVYSHIRLKQISEEESKKFHFLRVKEAVKEQGTDPVLNEKWQKVQAHINSTNPSDWRLAILEADIMLDTILEKMGYQGDSIGDKLKGVEKSDFLTLDLAWEAHKTRNQIAHQGSDFLLNDRDARRTIELYQKVFEEFFYI
ncbi:MAG: hypothetical protein RLZZ67_362 [Candidatus Parcubacteria bacterium]|jgi:hypothetical protein